MALRLVVAIAFLSLSAGLLRESVAAFELTADVCETDEHFAWIPAGEFVAGSDRAERDYAYRLSAQFAVAAPDRIPVAEAQLRQSQWFEVEAQRRRVTLPGFCLSRNLVTNADYGEFVAATGHRQPFISAEDYTEQGFLVHPYATVRSYLWANEKFPTGTGQHPVVLVSVEDATAYARWKGRQDGVSYRLPTADEWEKAARGTDGQYFPWGNAWQEGATNAVDSDLLATSAIAQFPLSRSIYGIEDMAGNVFEYTSTTETRNGQLRVVMKGCSWDDLPGFCRAAYKHTRPPESRHILFGFRLVLRQA
ncbi:MAG: SUMF1/EgtB/PvdO family nonheme iron enzyme [Cyanobacteria bacterium P01_D01_bin.123]